MSIPTLTARSLATGVPLALGEVRIVQHPRGKYRVIRAAGDLRVVCPACGCQVRALYEHPAGRGLVCIDCVQVALKALEGSL